MAEFNMNNLSTEDKAIAGAGIGVLIFSFFPWYGIDSTFIDVSANGWDMGISAKLGIFLALAAAVWVVLRSAGVSTPELPTGPAMITLLLAGVGALFLVYRAIDLPGGSSNIPGAEFDVGRKIGIYLAVLASLAQTFFAFRAFQASGEKMPEFGGGSASGSTPPTAPPPPA